MACENQDLILEKNIFTKGAFVQSNRPKQKQSNPASVVYRCTARADIRLKQLLEAEDYAESPGCLSEVNLASIQGSR